MKPVIGFLTLCFCLLTFAGIAQARSAARGGNHSKHPKAVKKTTSKQKKTARIQYGTASFYHNKFNGRRTANGEIFSQKKLTAAHNSVPLGTWIKVTNLRNKKTVIVKVTDRLHYRNKRIVDLSKAAATKLSFSKSGLIPVKVEILDKAGTLTKTK